jgi:hypothetical protein
MASFSATSDPRCPYVVCTEMGSSFCGIALSYGNDTNTVACSAPTANSADECRVPTLILLETNKPAQFGNAAKFLHEVYWYSARRERTKYKETCHLFAHFKADLTKVAQNCEATATADTGYGHGFFDLVVQLLGELSNSAFETILRERSRGGHPKADVLWVLPLPGSWDHCTAAFMRRAAFQAGLTASEQSENLLLVREPEVAALGMWNSLPEVSLLEEGDRFLTLHCGGSLIELVVQEVVTLSPLILKTVSGPLTLTLAGESVVSPFLEIMVELLSTEHYRENVRNVEMVKLRHNFQKVAASFDPRDEPAHLCIRDIIVNKSEHITRLKAYNAAHPEMPFRTTPITQKGYICMSRQMMLSFYEPSLSAIVKAIHVALADVPNIKQIVMTGGFSDSKAVQQRVVQEFHLQHGGVRVALPPKATPGHTSAASLAVARGAVLFAQSVNTAGLPGDPNSVRRTALLSRPSAYTYSVVMRINDVDDSFRVLVHKGQELSYNHEVSLPCSAVDEQGWDAVLHLYRCDAAAPTSAVDMCFVAEVEVPLTPICFAARGIRRQRLYSVVFAFGGAELRVKVLDRNDALVPCRVYWKSLL